MHARITATPKVIRVQPTRSSCILIHAPKSWRVHRYNHHCGFSSFELMARLVAMEPGLLATTVALLCDRPRHLQNRLEHVGIKKKVPSENSCISLSVLCMWQQDIGHQDIKKKILVLVPENPSNRRKSVKSVSNDHTRPLYFHIK